MGVFENTLRIGNKLNYWIEEEQAYFPTTIDWQDLKQLSENPESFNADHKPIELTEEILLKIKDVIFNGRGFVLKITDLHNLEIMSIGTPFLISLTTKDNKIPIAFHIEYLHQLQNLVYAMSNEELQIDLQ